MMKRHILISILASVILASPALAHTSISKSNIAPGASMEVLPAAYEFSFGQAVGLASLELKSKAGKSIPLSFNKPKSMQASFTVVLPELAPGDYVFHWRAVSKDGHVMTGKVPFTLGPAKP